MPIGAQWQAKNVDGEKQKRGKHQTLDPSSVAHILSDISKFCRQPKRRIRSRTPRRESKKQSTACIPPRISHRFLIAFMGEGVLFRFLVCSEVWESKGGLPAN